MNILQFIAYSIFEYMPMRVGDHPTLVFMLINITCGVFLCMTTIICLFDMCIGLIMFALARQWTGYTMLWLLRRVQFGMLMYILTTLCVSMNIVHAIYLTYIITFGFMSTVEANAIFLESLKDKNHVHEDWPKSLPKVSPCQRCKKFFSKRPATPWPSSFDSEDEYATSNS